MAGVAPGGPAAGVPAAGGPVAGGAVAPGPGKSGEERLKEMEAEMALFEQEVLGAPATGLPAPDPVPAVPAVPAVPVIRPIIATNTYQQVQQSLEARAAAAATVVAPIVGPPVPFVGPAGGPRPMALRPPHQGLVGPPLAGPPMMIPAMARAPGPPMGAMGTLRATTEETPHELALALGLGLKEKEAEGPVGPGLEEVGGAGTGAAGGALGGAGASVIGPSLPLPMALPLPEPEPLALPLPLEVVRGLLPPLRIPELLSLRPRRPPRPEPPPGLMAIEVPEPMGEDKKKGKPEKLKRCIRTAAGSSWEDPSLLEWDADDFRIFCGDLGNEVNDDILARAFSRFPSFLKAKVVRDKRTGKTKGYGFVSFKDPNDYVRAMREMNGKYVGSRPIKLRKSMWKDRNLDIVRKKQKEKKKLGLR
uniref:RNA-binding protein 42 n=1 Tax=Ornithorhynchus anatinus TaxID=9258 RepID=A0A6I8P847_ORNAN